VDSDNLIKGNQHYLPFDSSRHNVLHPACPCGLLHSEAHTKLVVPSHHLHIVACASYLSSCKETCRAVTETLALSPAFHYSHSYARISRRPVSIYAWCDGIAASSFVPSTAYRAPAVTSWYPVPCTPAAIRHRRLERYIYRYPAAASRARWMSASSSSGWWLDCPSWVLAFESSLCGPSLALGDRGSNPR